VNEAEVRYHVIDPILRRLGYGQVQGTYLYLEHKIEYPYYHIGHRSKKDLPIGFPDYRCGLDGRRGSFVVEAKKKSHDIGPIDREQAHSYASHAQVAANYFVLCNGRSFEVYETLSTDLSTPILEMDCERIDDNFHQVENILSINSIKKNCHVSYDRGLRISSEYGSTATIMNGRYEVDEVELKIYGSNDYTNNLIKQVPQFSELENLKKILKEFVYTVDSGEVSRGEDGRIVATADFGSVTKGNRQSMKLLGLDKIQFFSSDQFMSEDPDNPSIFEVERKIFVAKGSEIFPLFGPSQKMETDMRVDAFIVAKLSGRNGIIKGDFSAFAVYSTEFPFIGSITAEADFFGQCEIRMSTQR
jgi:hypothetical protein